MEETLANSENELNQSTKYEYDTHEKSKSISSSMAEIPSDIAQVHVKVALDSIHSVRTVFRKNSTIATMKASLADAMNVDEMEFSLKCGNEELDDSKCLDELVENPLVPVEINLSFFDSQRGIEKFEENIPSQDVITVYPQYGQSENITVVIENQSIQKQWLGGYRNKLNGIEYYHAGAQTSPEVKDVARYSHRETQTVELKTTGTATAVSRGTQMRRHDHYILSNNDKIIVAKPIKPFQRGCLRLYHTMAIVIQRAWRSYDKRKRTISRQQEEEDEKRELIEEISLEHSLRDRLILAGAVFPSKRDDFAFLHLNLGVWLKKNYKFEHFHRTDSSRKAMQYLLLKREVSCLFAIEKHKIYHKKEVLRKEGIRFLEKTSCPKTFKNKSGNLVSMDDINTQRARELKEIYSELIKREVKPTDRISFLNTFRKLFTDKFATYEYANEIVSLVDREITLITMGMRNKALKGGRLRMEQLYMHFVKLEEFNPKATKYEKFNLPLTIHYDYMCIRCRRLFRASKFPVHFGLKRYSVCTSCKWMYAIGHMHTDDAPYKILLKQVRWDEMDKCSNSAACFLLQPTGMAFLTNQIWHDHSAISECSVMRTLRHVRWLRDIDWTPWNTILLTAEEAQFHSCIPNVYQFYDPSFIMLVHKRHIMARNHFKDLEKVNLSICSSGEWTSPEEAAFYIQKHYSEEFIVEDYSEML